MKRFYLLAIAYLLISTGFVFCQESKPKEKEVEKEKESKSVESNLTEKKAEDKKTEDKKAEDKKEGENYSVITVTMPNDDATLSIDGKEMKTPGKKREFDTPILKSGKEYSYRLEARYMPNNYTTVIRSREIKFTVGKPLSVDLSKEDENDKMVIRYVPTPEDVVLQMLKLGKVGKEDVVYDLGCGDARLVISAVKETQAKKGVGIDIDIERVNESKANIKREKVEDKITIVQGDLLDDKVLEKVSEATVILTYMGDEFNALLKPKLLKHLKPGTRIISHRFKFGDWKPEKSITVTGEDGENYDLHLWVVSEKK